MSIWGVARPQFIGTQYIPAADVTLTAGTPVLIATTTTGLVAGTPGGYAPLLLCTVVSVQGGTAASALKYSFRFNGGADIASYTLEPGELVNSAERSDSFVLVGVESASAWVGAGTIVELWGSATTQAVTVKKVGTQFLPLLLQGANP
jgi:hypothetical protein